MHNIIFTKYSRERDPRYAIRTDIVSDEQGNKKVIKSKIFDSGTAHIQGIMNNCGKLQALYDKSDLSVNKCWSNGNTVEFEFIEGKNLEVVLDECIVNHQIDRLKEILIGYLEAVKKLHCQEVFAISKEFVAIFGEVILPGQLKCAALSNIDLIVANILIKDKKMTVIDYEWTFDFQIPVNYILYRILHYYIDTSAKRTSLNIEEFYEKLGITQVELVTYKGMEEKLQKHIYGSRKPICNLYNDISLGSVSFGELWNYKEAASCRIQVFYGMDTVFTEEHTKVFYNRFGVIKRQIKLPSKSAFVRIDPCDQGCILEVESLLVNGKEVPYTTNGELIEDKKYIFNTMDPQVHLADLGEGEKEISLAFKLSKLEEESLKLIVRTEKHCNLIMNQLEDEIEKLKNKISGLNCLIAEQEALTLEKERQFQVQITQKQEEITRQADLIKDMENTKVWRMYEKYRKVFKW